jgi:hypothetical protein
MFHAAVTGIAKRAPVARVPVTIATSAAPQVAARSAMGLHAAIRDVSATPVITSATIAAQQIAASTVAALKMLCIHLRYIPTCK